MTNQQKSDFISKIRSTVTAFNSAIDQFNSLNRQFVALDLGGVLVDEDFTGANDGIKAQDFTDAIKLIDGVLKNLPAGSDALLYKISN